MDFIFMLTRDDRTVTDCLDVLDDIAGLGITHIGFKDVGVDADTLARLHTRIRALGATSYLEVVSTDRAQALASVRTAVELGVDQLLGGTWIDDTLPLLRGTGIAYLPFAGEPLGHPTRLAGGPDRIAADCRRAEAAGCAGVDLLAYRATDADPLDLVRAARAATGGRLVVAGSIASTERIRALADAGADAFTIGSAAFDGSLRPRAGTLRAQLAPVLEAVRAPVR
ncbi:HisA/HisF-related TIM barrel protein [Streptomyces solicathayae]|uniref:HisA/HisF-related TIM barrel protein n=1 Tax=Streptomyces solicathayae TaxID=3081768 RepID=A0ABZ0LL27_9ACTN|nr:HisA/HisF-related TIM barrel protein [Streptomyces sp. HUAS YS2]WOX20207.1 HisA/HisF-related TIM barrel protein [Streptomyces sp. HUAS YS2]